MTASEGKATRYRERADGLRQIAANLPVGNDQRLLLSIASEYEWLAQLLETRDPSQDPAAILAARKKLNDSR